MPAAIRFADANGTSIAYEVISDGDVDLVVIGGMATHLEILHADANSAHLLRRLAAFSRLIVFDRSGVGCSDPVAVVPALEDRVAEILAVMDAAGSRRCVLLGISEGAALAAYFAATQPERVSKLVMWVAIVTGRQTPERPWGIRPLAFAMLRTSLERWGEGLTIDFTAPLARVVEHAAADVGDVRATARRARDDAGARTVTRRARRVQHSAFDCGADARDRPHRRCPGTDRTDPLYRGEHPER